MFALLAKYGSIEDVGLGLNWNTATLTHETTRRAAFLSQLGIGRGSVVAIAHGGTAYFFADLFATWSVGATAACLDVSLTPAELQNVVHFAKAAVLLVDRKAAIENVTVPVVELGRLPPTRASTTIPAIDLDDPALVIFTSGTTGTPKGVVLSFRALLTRITANIAAIGTRTLARALVTLPTHFGHGLIGNSLTPLLAGGDIVLHPLGIPLAHNLGCIVDEHNISFMSSVPTLWHVATIHSRPPLGGSLARVHVGSAPLSAALWSRVATWSRAEVVNCYGITETANWIAGASSRADGIAQGLVGKMWGGTAAVMDDSGSIGAAGDGEIVVRSPSLMAGYLDRPELTAEAVSQGWFRTGDRGSVDDRGCIWLTGRIRDEINRSGFKVQPAEIDAVLESHPAIAEACVFGIPDSMSGEAVAAAIRLASGATASAESLQAWCRERMRRDAVPEHWFFVADIPRTPRGKISRDGVCRMLAKDTDAALTLRSTKPAESQGARTAADTAAVIPAVERAWTEVFGRHSFAANIAWDECGGDSLDALRLWIVIEEILGSRLPLDVLELGMTPTRLAAAIEQQLRPSAGKTVLNQLSRRPPAVIFMPPATGDLPMLARFRAKLKDQIRFVVIQYPAWREMLAAGAGFDVLVDAAVSQIHAECGDRDVILLAGYSFGGFVARETARRIVENGRRVSFLGLIDTRCTSPRRARRNLLDRVCRTLRLVLLRQTELLVKAPRRIIAALICTSAFPLLRLMGHLALQLPPRASFALHLELITQLRTKSLRRMLLKPLLVPTTLFRSDDPSSLPDYGWHAHCGQLTMIPISGSHQTLFEPPTCDILSARFLEAVEAASATSLLVDGPADDGALDLAFVAKRDEKSITDP
jgi:acyl-CoA synthetase (AMP-forming)/AMP-acid ligase II/thioesterase domain-containing protein